MAGMGTVPNAGPVRRMGLDPFAKLFVFGTRARQHGNEAAAGTIDMVHVLARTQFGIGDVEEVRSTRHGTQCVPGVDMGAGIAGVAVAAAKRDGDTAIGSRGKNEQELFEIGTVVLGDAIGDRRPRSAADLAAPRAAISAAEAHRGAIVMDLLELQAESLADRQDHIGEQRRTIGIKQAVEGPPQAVIAKVLHLLGRDAEHTGGEALHGLLLAIDRLSLHDDRAQQHAERSGVWDATALIGGNVSIESIVQSHTRNEMIYDGEGPEAFDTCAPINA